MTTHLTTTAKPSPAALALTAQPPPAKTSDLQKVGRLLDAFGATALGEGDLVAGANVLAAMACSLANLQRPGTGLVDKDGAKLPVGTSLLVSGSLSAGLVGERVLSGLATRQNNLAAHLREWCRKAEIEMAKPLNTRRFDPAAMLEQGGSSVLFELHKEAGMSNFVDPHLGKALIAPPKGQGKRDLHDRPLVYVTAGKPAELTKTLERSHLGRPFVHVAVHGPAACPRFDECCTAVMDGSLAAGPLSETVHGCVIATDPFDSLAEVVRAADGRSASWITRMLWLTDSAAGPEPGDITPDKAKVGLDDIQGRYEAAMDAAWEARLDYSKHAPGDVSCEWPRIQAEWITFLRGMEAEIPGITGMARPLLATLIVGLSRLANIRVTAKDFELAAEDIMALARWLVRRMANARAAMLHTEHEARLQRMCTKIIHKLAGSPPLTVRDFTRSIKYLNADDCREGLLLLQARGAVTCLGNTWCVAAAAGGQLQPLTLNV